MKRLAVLVVPLAALTLAASASGASAQWSSGSVWSATSVWNQKIPAGATIDPQSSTFVQDLGNQIASNGTWINTDSYSVPVYVVPKNEPTQPVTLEPNPDNPDSPQLAADWAAVPIPPNAQAAQGTMVVYQPGTQQFWEFWGMQGGDGNWEANWGGYMSGVKQSTTGLYPDGAGGIFNEYFGTRATGLPLLGGLISAYDIVHGTINHALVMQIPSAQAACFNLPAYRTDGNGAYDPTQIPEGLMLRLPASLNIKKLKLPWLINMIALAAQKYGIYIADQGGSVAFFGEDTVDEGNGDIWDGPTGAFQGQSPSALLAQFPWADLEAIDPPYSPLQYCGWQIPYGVGPAGP